MVADMTEWQQGSRPHSISSKIHWRVRNGRTEVRVVDDDADTQRNALLDALHLWRVEANSRGAISLDVSGASRAVREELGTLLGALAPDIDVSVTPRPAPNPNFTAITRKWPDLLRRRDKKLKSLPPLAERLQRAVADGSFYWTKTLYSRVTGRLDGLKVCELVNDDLVVMRIGQSEKAQSLFEEIVGEPELQVSDATAAHAAEVLQRLAASRKSGRLSEIQREHLLEARVLRGAVDVHTPAGRPMTPAIARGQFPTRWATTGNARYLDALMRDRDEPWALELKIRSGGAGQYLRHGVGQAVLYRAFIKRADAIHPYLEGIGVDAAACKAAVAFPVLTGRDAAFRTGDVAALARLFDVDVLELDAQGL